MVAGSSVRTEHADVYTAIRALTALSATGDPMNRSLAGRALAGLVRLRRELPARRQGDRKIR